MANSGITGTGSLLSSRFLTRSMTQYPATAQQYPRFVDLVQEGKMLSLDVPDTEVVLPSEVCNPRARSCLSAFRCTFRLVPQTRELLKKSHLPFGLMLQHFRSVEDMTVVNMPTIIRCRYCRAYINPYIYLPDARHWQCNLCQRLNDLPEDFDLSSIDKSFGKALWRPEMRCAIFEFTDSPQFVAHPPHPIVYLFIVDVSSSRAQSAFLDSFVGQLLFALERVPSNERTLIGFMAVDAALHLFQFHKSKQPRHIIVVDIEDVFIPVGNGLLINFLDNIEMVRSFVRCLPSIFQSNRSGSNCIGAALNVAYELVKDFGGRITIMQTTLPNVGPGALADRENANRGTSLDEYSLRPSTDFYKSLALRLMDRQIAVDLFLLNGKYADLATLAEVAKFSGGCVYHYCIDDDCMQRKRFEKQFADYLTRDIGFDAMLRIRCSRGITPHTFYGNFFVRSFDLMMMGNVNPNSAIGIKLEMEEDLTSLTTVSFQAALVYTSSKGDRRVRVHTLCLPLTTDLLGVYNNFDARCAIALLSKIASQHSIAGSHLSDSREDVIRMLTDAFKSFNLAVAQQGCSSFLSPNASMRLLPLYILGMLKHRAFSSDRSARIDEIIAALLLFRVAPLEILGLEIYPALYKLNQLVEGDDDPPRLHLSYDCIERDGMYLLDTGSYVCIYVMTGVDRSLIRSFFGVDCFERIDEDEALIARKNLFSERVHNFLRRLSIKRATCVPVITLREDGRLRDAFTDRLIEDSIAFSRSYIDFLHYIHQKMQ